MSSMSKNIALKLRTSFFLLLCLVVMPGCGGGGSSDAQNTEATGISISGTISPATTSQVDGDTNDPRAINSDNDNAIQAQLLPNPVIVGGFASSVATGNPGDRFESSTDLEDWYRISLAEGQTVTLTISDHDGTVFAPDLDLYLTAISAPLDTVQSSDGFGPAESINVAASGEYYLVVVAFEGATNYLLSVGQSATGTAEQTMRIEDDFIAGDLIVGFKDSSAGLESPMAGLGLQSVAGRHSQPRLMRLGNLEQRKAVFNTLGIASGSPLGGQKGSTEAQQQLKLDTIRAVKALRQRDDVKSADLNYIRKPLRTPADEFYRFQWHYPLINLPQAWDISTGDSSVVVAVIDTGVIMNHPDLDSRLCTVSDDCRGYDFISSLSISVDGDGIDSNPDDPGDGSAAGNSSFHGTHVAGTIGAESNTVGPGSGVSGVTWNTRIMPLRALGQGGGTSYDIIQSLLYAAGLDNDSGTVPDKTADIINLSLGGGGYSQTEQNVYNQVRGQGIVVIAAAGNESSNILDYPASYSGVISVGAVDLHKELAYYSNFGTQIDVVAPGGDSSVDSNGDGFGDGVLSTLGDDSGAGIDWVYDFYQGTSMAAPHMAGVVALMKAVYPDLTPLELEKLIMIGAITEDLSGDGESVRNDTFGYGLIDAHKAVLQANGLANGGELPPSLGFAPSALNFGSTSISLDLEVSNLGGGSLIVDAVTENVDWITAIDLVLDEGDGLGTYRITVNRSGLPDAIYNTMISFTTSEGFYSIPATMQVGAGDANGDAGYHWILLLDTFTGDTVEVTSVPLVSGRYQYRFNDVNPGHYHIIAGTDSDNDGFLCDSGEACSGFPLLNQLSTITISTENISGIDFVSGFETAPSEASQAQTPLQVGPFVKSAGKRIGE